MYIKDTSQMCCTKSFMEKVFWSMCTSWKLFDPQDILYNVRKDGDVRNPITGRFLELDLWIPKYNICFEFQVSIIYLRHNILITAIRIPIIILPPGIPKHP